MTTCLATTKMLAVDRRGLIRSVPRNHFKECCKLVYSENNDLVWVTSGHQPDLVTRNHYTRLLWLLAVNLQSPSTEGRKALQNIRSEIYDTIRDPLIALTKRSLILVSDGKYYPADEGVDFYVIGSGAIHAQTAFHYKPDPKFAVQFACDNDPYTGDGVDVVRARQLKDIKVK